MHAKIFLRADAYFYGALIALPLAVCSASAEEHHPSTLMNISHYPVHSAPAGFAEGETLQQAWAAALAADHRLQASAWGAKAAESGLRSAQGARLPSVRAENWYTVRDRDRAFVFDMPSSGLPPTRLPYQQREDYSFGVGGRLPLYTSGRVGEAIEAAESELYAAEMVHTRTHLEVKMAVGAYYISVLRAERAVEVSESTVRSLNSHADDVRMRYDNGMVPYHEFLAAQVSLSNARQRAIQTANALDIARAGYNRQLGRPMTRPVHLAPVVLDLVETDVDQLIAHARANRPERAELAARAEALRHQAASLRGSIRPQAELHGGYHFQENRFQDPEGIASIGVGVYWDLYDGGVAYHRARELEQQAEQLTQLRAEQESLIALEVRQAWLDVAEARRRVEVTREAVGQSEENLRVSRESYNLGRATNTEVLEAEVLRSESQHSYHQGIYDVALATLRLARASGDL